MDIGAFLKKMTSETGKQLSLPESKIISPISTPKPPSSPTSVKNPAKPKIKPKRNAEFKKELRAEESTISNNEINEESIEQIYEVTSIVMKSIRKAFPDKKTRRLAFESLSNALHLALGGKFETVQESIDISESELPSESITPASTPSTPKPKPMLVMSEEEWDNIPRDRYEPMPMGGLRMNPDLLESNPITAPPSRTMASIKPGQGALNISDQDINDIRVLSGIVEESNG